MLILNLNSNATGLQRNLHQYLEYTTTTLFVTAQPYMMPAQDTLRLVHCHQNE